MLQSGVLTICLVCLRGTDFLVPTLPLTAKKMHLLPSDNLSQRQAFYSTLGGCMFAAGWWCLIDGFNMGQVVFNDPASKQAAGFSWLPPFGATLFYLFINAMSWRELDDRKVAVPATATKARGFLLFSLVVAMCSVVGAAFIMVDKFLKVDSSYRWAGVSVLVSTLVL